MEIFPDLNYAVALTLMAVGVDMIMTAAGKELPVYVLVCFMVSVFLLGIASSFIRGIVSQCTPTGKRASQASRCERERGERRRDGLKSPRHSKFYIQ